MLELAGGCADNGTQVVSFIAGNLLEIRHSFLCFLLRTLGIEVDSYSH